MPVPRRAVALVAALACTLAVAAAPPSAATDAPIARASSATSGVAVDTREDLTSARALAVATARARFALRRSLGRMGVFEIDPKTGTARVVARLDGYLTAPSSDPASTIALDYVRRHQEAFGLTDGDLRTLSLASDRVDEDGVHHLAWTQSTKGIQAFDNGLKASVAPGGELIALSGSPAHGLGSGAVTAVPRVSAGRAISRSRSSVGAHATPARGDTARLVWFHGGRSRLAWQTLTNISSAERNLSVVDAVSGDILWRVNLVDGATGSGLAWELYPGSGVPNGGGVQQPVSFPVNASGARLAGPNAHVYADTRDDNTADPGDEIPALTGLDWGAAPGYLSETPTAQNCDPSHACTWNRHVARSWQPNRRQNAVQVYHYLNVFHDHLLASPIGFTERLGNFQTTNPSGQGEGRDAVQAEIMDGAATAGGVPDVYHYNNANMFTPPDGQAPTMQMYLFRGDQFVDWTSGNAGDDATVVYHEYTHGLSSRLVTYPNGVQALNAEQSGAMGEGWSDWYAMDYLVGEGVVTDTASPGEVLVGEQITAGQGIRFQAMDCTVGAPGAACPAAAATGPGGFTYGDYADVYFGPEIHSDGEIWAQALWDLRDALGVNLARKLITRAMLLSPPDPSFLDMRNAILQADVAYDGGAGLDTIWSVFAGRGMGYFASAVDADDVSPAQSFAVPPDCAVDPCGTIRGRVTDSITGEPAAGVTVAIGGHGTGFPGTDLVDRSDADGRYTIKRVPHHTYEDIIFDRWGLEPLVVHGVTVDGTETLRRSMRRDWAALDGGATIERFTRPDYSQFGCGPSGALDRSLTSGWGSDAPRSTFGSSITGPRELVIRLPKVVDIASFGVDAGATCGDGPSAATKAFDVYTRTANGSWVLALRVRSGAVSGRLATYVPTAGRANVRTVKFVMVENRGDPYFMDMTEFSVRGR
ncbi:MAG TPA: M36 family metallopeptidase [Actinomycetota bacterium]